MKTFGQIVLVILALGLISLGLFTCNWVGNGVQTVHQEYDPSVMLKKYEWFKNQSAFITKAQKDIANLKSESDVRGQYEQDNGKNHSTWSPIVVNAYQDEVSMNKQQRLALVSNTNKLIADYNAQSAKFTWTSFKTRDDLPPQTYEDVK